MIGIRLHWLLHPDKAKGLYYDETGKPRSPWYDNEIKSKQMTKAAVARELDISYEMSVEGIVYPEFRETHIQKTKFTVNPQLPVNRFVDYGRVNACIFSQMQNTGQLVFFKEIVLENTSTDTQAKIIESQSALIQCAGFKDFGDPSGEYADVNTSTTSVQLMQKHGINPSSKAHQLKGAKRLTARTDLLRAKLSERIGGEEAILVTQDCQTIIDAFQSGYRYKETITGEILDTIHEIHPYEDVIDCVAGTVLELFTVHQNVELPPERRSRNKYTGY